MEGSPPGSSATKRQRPWQRLWSHVAKYAVLILLISTVSIVALTLSGETLGNAFSTIDLIGTSGTPSTGIGAPGDPTPPPTATSTTRKDDVLEAVREALREAIRPGRIAFNPPTTMQFGETVLVEVRLTVEPSDMMPDEQLLRDLEGPGNPTVESSGVSPLMTVELQGRGFRVEALSPMEQAVVDGFTEWEFEVTPEEGGPLTLNLTASARLIVDDLSTETEVSVPTIRRDIDVEVSTVQAWHMWWAENWTWLLGVVVAVVGTGAVVLRLRGTRPPEGAAAEGSIPTRVFVSYRRSDAPGTAGRLRDRLVAVFGETNVFLDTENIDPGEDYVSVIERHIVTSEAVLVVVGPRWLELMKARSHGFEENEVDYVRVEIETARQHGVTVIPVLVEGASLPAAEELPDGCEYLAKVQVAEIDLRTFSHDVDELVVRLGKLSVWS